MNYIMYRGSSKDVSNVLGVQEIGKVQAHLGDLLPPTFNLRLGRRPKEPRRLAQSQYHPIIRRSPPLEQELVCGELDRLGRGLALRHSSGFDRLGGGRDGFDRGVFGFGGLVDVLDNGADGAVRKEERDVGLFEEGVAGWVLVKESGRGEDEVGWGV